MLYVYICNAETRKPSCYYHRALQIAISSLTTISNSKLSVLFAWETDFVSLVTRERFAGEKIPTLEEAVEECIKLQLTIYFDVKGHPDEVKPTKLTNKSFGVFS